MSKTRFTPGPWHPYQGGIHPDFQEHAAPNASHAICAEFFGPDAEFNRALVSAATDLYEALKAACDAIGDWSRPTAMNGMTVPSHDDPLILAMKRGYNALAEAHRETS